MPQNNAPVVFKGGWEELQNATHTDNNGSIADASAPEGIYITPNGNFLFTVENTQQIVRKYQLSIPWDVATISSTIDTFDLSGDSSSTPTDIDFKPDGTIMFVSGQFGNIILRYVLPIPFDISSIVDTPTSFVPAGGLVSAMEFSTDGFSFFTLRDGAIVLKHSTDTAFDFDNVTEVQTFSTGKFDVAITFKEQGDKMYLGDISERIREFNLSAPFDISAPVDTGRFFDAPASILTGIQFRSNGKEFFTIERVPSEVTRFHVDEEWNIDTVSLFENSKFIGNNPQAVSWKPDGTRMIVLTGTDKLITDFSTPNPWNLSTTTQDSTFLFTSSGIQTGMFWKPDGTRCYVLNDAANLVQFNVATPWTVSTMSDPSISHTFSSVIFTNDIFFRQDGKKVYLINIDFSTFAEIREYDLGTAWDITTIGATPVNTFDAIATSGVNISGVFFKPDGKIMIISDNTLITRYSLSTPWSLLTSNVTFIDSFDTTAQTSLIEGIFIRQNDGKKLFVVDIVVDTIFSYDMTLEFNNSIITTFGESIITTAGEDIVHT